MVTAAGIEGGAVYALGPDMRAALDAHGPTRVSLDLRPDLGVAALEDRLARRRPRDSQSSALRRAGLASVAVGLLRESTPLVASPAHGVKNVGLIVTGMQPIDRAISSAGGIAFAEVDERFMLRRRPGTFVAGEMLDWEAPTGGYLLQATFSTAVAAARGAAEWLRRL